MKAFIGSTLCCGLWSWSIIQDHFGLFDITPLYRACFDKYLIDNKGNCKIVKKILFHWFPVDQKTDFILDSGHKFVTEYEISIVFRKKL